MRLLRFFTPVVVWVVLFLPLAGAPTVAADEEPARLLVVTVANGYVHEVIPVMEEVIETLGRESGLYAVDFARTNEALKEKTTPEALEGYDGVVFANTSRDVPVADREAFLAWIEGGGAFVGIHGASTLESWPELTAVLGGQFDYHKDQATVNVRVDDAGHPASDGLVSGFEIHEEMYLYKRFDRQRVHMLLSLDRHPNTREPGFFPWAWTRVQGEGRVFHTGAGHREDIVRSDWFARHVLGGIRWSLGG
jgi:type 1 glutamine amidotransferase